MFKMSPVQLLYMLGFRTEDPELLELVSALVLEYQQAADKRGFLKEAIRKALVR